MIATAPVDIESLVKAELPTLPRVAMRVATLTQDFNSSAREIADAIGCDPILGARVLRAANSPLYYLERDVTTLKMAVNALGNRNIHQLVVASAAIDAFQRKGRSAAFETTLWEHSIAVGLAAREIMSLLGLRGGEQAFICGLLHDIGKLLLMRNDIDAYRRILSNLKEGESLAAERAAFGYTHAQVGALATNRWSLPEQITQTIYHHHQPSQADDGMLLARVVDVADALANRAGLGFWTEGERDLADSESVIALRVSADQLDEVWAKSEKGVTETFALFSR
jgi:putative nucleotidyltransferase with HDIG domain